MDGELLRYGLFGIMIETVVMKGVHCLWDLLKGQHGIDFCLVGICNPIVDFLYSKVTRNRFD